MKNNQTFLAIVPARGGSKRLPGKNKRNIAGKPLIAWSIEAGTTSRYIDKIAVTSDDLDILEISQKYGADSIQRPEHLATDSATTFDAILHAINIIPQKFDYIVLLQPTSPLRFNTHVNEAIDLLIEKKADAVISVCEVEHSPLWSNSLPDSMSMDHFLREEIKNKRSQDLATYYRLNGAIYICKTEVLLKNKSFFPNEKSFAFVMNKKNSIDIDDHIDFKLGEVILNEILCSH